MWNQTYFTKLSIIIDQWVSRIQNHSLLYCHQSTICITPFPLVKYICGTPLILYLMTCLQAFKQISKDSPALAWEARDPFALAHLRKTEGSALAHFASHQLAALLSLAGGPRTFITLLLTVLHKQRTLIFLEILRCLFVILTHLQISSLRINNSYLHFIYIYILKIAKWANHLIDGRGCSSASRWEAIQSNFMNKNFRPSLPSFCSCPVAEQVCCRGSLMHHILPR